ncbi:hypothetical protein KL86DES1_21180 [uncultured Desulfovibrio sp.]|uniref:Uncharacterized protein n=1 Tax=uncultured Desulfovibrio sp. TaxID=167968 RepID=A0A212L6Q1_9BACT|nr:hypothetical protein KL86DES1_21180 [uncultured Desulfovibrio sp.]VZH34076.1 conserved protein of unknown function [Desulfovibrio sp. 86]
MRSARGRAAAGAREQAGQHCSDDAHLTPVGFIVSCRYIKGASDTTGAAGKQSRTAWANS